jgi:uncharacterized membrane protein
VLAFALGHHLLFDLETLGFGSSRPTDGVRTQWVAGITGAAAILAVAWLLRRARARRTNLTDLEARSGTGLILTATAFLLYLLSVQVWRSLEDEGERRALLGLSLAWAVYGGGLIAIGFLRHFRPLRLAGVGLLLGLVLKLFTLDMSVLERGERIASFIGVGVLLLVVSLLYQNRRRKEEPNDD